jgi:hypothetical protein
MPAVIDLDATPLIAPPPIGTAFTRIAHAGPPMQQATQSGTDVIARILAASVGPAWFDRLVHYEPVWPDLIAHDRVYPVATGTVTYDTTALPVRAAASDANVMTARLEPALATSLGARAYAAFKDLGRWLMLDDPSVARMVGIKRTTPYAWEREGRQPRPATVRRLMQHHAVIGAVVDRLGEDSARAWLVAGSPSPVELLLDGHLDAVDQQVGDLVFSRSVRAPSAGGYLPEDDDDVPPSQIAARHT